MSRLIVEGDELVLGLSTVEKVEGMHGDIRVVLSCIRDVRAVDNAWSELRGIRAPGTGIPGVIAVGTRRGRGFKDFTVVHGRGPAVVVDLEGVSFDRLVVSQDDAEVAAADLRTRIRRS